MKIRTVKQAVKVCKERVRSNTREFAGMCGLGARTAYSEDIVSEADTAREKALRTQVRGKGDAPEGALVWWDQPPAGHVVISDGNGNGYGNWWKDQGRYRKVPVETISLSLGRRPIFWSRDIDGQLVCPEPVDKPRLTYTVKAGDTLGEIARRFDTTVAKLAKVNGIDEPDLIVTGTKLRLQ